MLPKTENLIGTLKIGRQPSKTYKMRIEEEKVDGQADDLEAIEQACYKILNTERYRYVIYSWNYGIELSDLFGKPIPFVYSELPRRIREALTADDRVKDVANFALRHERGSVLARFEVVTTNGILEMSKGVNVV